MKNEYDFSKARKNPYAKFLKKQQPSEHIHQFFQSKSGNVDAMQIL